MLDELNQGLDQPTKAALREELLIFVVINPGK